MSDRAALNKDLLLRRVGRHQYRTTVLAPQSVNAFLEGDSAVHSPRESDGQANVPSGALTRPKCELDQLGSTIDNLSTRAAALSEIEKEIDATKALLTSLLMRRNNLTPVFLLPPELLARIFHFHTLAEPPWHGVTSNKLGWIIDTHVCRHWRQVALDHASLWATISGFPLSLRWISEQLSRTKNSPLAIELLANPSAETISLVPSHLPHTRGLRLRGLNKVHFSGIKELCALEAPDLEHFELGFSVADPFTSKDFVVTGLFQGKAPKLRSLSLFQVRVPWSFFPRCQFTQIKIVLCEEEWNEPLSPESLEQLFDLLTNCPNLEVLALECCLPSILSQSLHKRTVHLPRLTYLSLAGSICRVVRFFEALSMPSSTKLNLHCVAQNSCGNEGGVLIPLVFSHFHRSSVVTFRSFRAAINLLERSLEITASTSPPASRFPRLVFLRAQMAIPPSFRYRSSPIPSLVTWRTYSSGRARSCPLRRSNTSPGHGTCALLQTMTPPKTPNKPSNNNSKGKKKGRGKKDVPSEAVVDNAPVCAPVFPKLTSLLLKKFDFSESVSHIGIVYNVLMMAIRRRKNAKIPLKMLSIERSILCQKNATALEKVVREFHWSGEEAMSFDEYDFDDFDHYSSDYHDARWDDFFMGSSQAERDWWENYSDGY
ncbi:hypothetical protein EI94DRAFT_1734100 [Lactarius quietus]|nr:hypothetical protein EI94DRAFT_1734100 [Lactarius quietus]